MNGEGAAAPSGGAPASPGDPAAWPGDPASSRLAENVMHFARVLRTAGLPVGTDRIQLALQALPLTGLQQRDDVRAALAACFVDRADQRLLFDQAFELFWRDPDLLNRALATRLPPVEAKSRPDMPPPPPAMRRLDEAMHQPPPKAPEQADRDDDHEELDAPLTWSARERLHGADFDSMSADEWRAAQRALRTLRLTAEPLKTRRFRRAAHPGRVDWRATLQAMARQGGELWDLRWRRARVRPAPVVVLADISGSMSRYSRMLLHFAHTLARSGIRVESFVFGTRLTRVTHAMRQRDPDAAIGHVMQAVADWGGGTRIATCLHEFNQRWARRVLPGNATVLLISDGLEYGDTSALTFEMQRLHKSCRRLLWLNPLLRFAGFRPRAAGIKAMSPHVDHLLRAHNIDSLEQLAELLAAPTERRAMPRSVPFAPPPLTGTTTTPWN